MKIKEWAPVAEVIASVAVVITLIALIVEIRQGALMQEQQMQMDRIAILNDPFLSSPELATVYAKVKAVDGLEPVAEAFIERYELTVEEAVLWSRLVQSVWQTWQSQYLFGGPSEELESNIRDIFHYPDVQIVYQTNEDGMLKPEFIAYVDSIIGDK